MQQTREWQQFGGYSGRESSITQNAVVRRLRPPRSLQLHEKEREKEKTRGREWDGSSLLQDRPRHMPGLFWTAPGHSHLWCSPAEAHNCCHGSVCAPGESQTMRAQKPIHVSAKGFCQNGACDTHCILVFLLFKRSRVSLPPHLCHLFFIPQLSLRLGLVGR